MKNLVIFTDLDGTLLDHRTYSFEPAMQALGLIKEKGISLVICSSKTKKEIEYYRNKLGNPHPFISENGGGIFIPKGYFAGAIYEFPLPSTIRPEFQLIEENDYDIIRLGAKYTDLRKLILELREEGYAVKGFGDMTIEELSIAASMTAKEAGMAKERNFDEPFIFEGPDYKLTGLLRAINEKGFKFTQGRFFHILGSSNKGVAVSMLMDLYKNKFQDIRTIAIGDSPNDIPMLERVDSPVIVQKSKGVYDPRIKIPDIIKAEGIGPEGWNKAIMELIKNL